MSAISKMKSLLTQTPWSTLIPSSPKLPRKTPLALFSVASSSFPTNPPRFRSLAPRRSSLCLAHTRDLQSDSASRSVSGEIHVIVGPMFAGKTTTLLRRVQSERSHGRNVAVIKSNKDTRYGLDSIVTHDGVRLPCWALEDLTSFRQKVGSDAYSQIDVIGIDEAQFFEDLYDFCCEAADRDGKTVVVSGLDGDYLRRSFGSVLDIIPLADSVTKLSSRCELCEKSAFFTLRKSEETRTELIGGAEVYMPVCRQHYVAGQVAIKATRVALESQVHSTSYA